MWCSLRTPILLALGFLSIFHFGRNAAETTEDRKELIREKIGHVLQDDPDSFTRAMIFLDKEDNDYQGQGMSPVWKTLSRVLDKESHFNSYLNRLVKDTRTGKEDESYRFLVEKIWSEFLEASDKPEDLSKHQGFVLKGPDVLDLETTFVNGVWNFFKEVLTSDKLKDIVQHIERHPSSVFNSFLKNINYENVKDLAKVADNLGVRKAKVPLAAVILTAETVRNIRKWMSGEISGAQCLKKILDSFASVCTAAYVGMQVTKMASVAFGRHAGMAAGMAGGAAAGLVAHSISDWLTQKLFSLPKSEALANAYHYLGVKATASNEEVNQKYWELTLMHDPQTGGWEDEFHKVQIAMTVIKVARGQKIN